ncbi:MAG: ferritin-like domain-containing protein [Actinomycetota bacterium]|nr:ferritin-like domain-containing protein [Actinomycetota bacterium]
MHDTTEGRMQRAGFLRRAALVAGSAAGASLLLGPRQAEDAEAQTAADKRALNLALLVEYAEADFYATAVKEGKLDGELRAFAEQVSQQEDDHVAFIKSALGSGAQSKPQFDFGSTTSDPDAFADRAAALEDLAVAAYAGQAGNLSKPVLRSAATLISVEARHAAWIRSIVGRPPANEPTDKPRNADQVMTDLKRLGMKG